MKSLYSLILLSLLVGCSSDYQIAKTNPTPYTTGEEITLFEKPSEFARKLGTIPIDEEIIGTGRYIRWVETTYNGKTGFVLDNNLLTKAEAEKTKEERKYKKEVEDQRTVFFISKDKAEDSWGRAQAFVGRYSSMKVQVATDYIIQTFNPIGTEVAFGYSISKAPVDGGFEFSVKVSYSNMFTGSDAEQNAKVCSLYILTGKINPSFIKQ